ncbi:hypothetical protein [Marinimicrobium sp. ABcell2]|uniref:hypothetical protein n=1 Tax=Marinimicrobium sp. ABcell2 TaxID=3069751 RepID=UPI0027B2E2C2|nr:hypothetical protein [Marinimicrobium sp. ABcell2]MDQ2077371.1 hypothetical protein [Marinimicrobium sp. ABcell2]
MRAYPKITDELFGITWIERSKTYRVLLGNEPNEDDPFFRSHFGVKKHGSKEAALLAAKAERDRQLKKPEFKAYFRHQVNGRRVKRPRQSASAGVSGVIFSKGVRDRGTITVSPTLIVYAGGEVVEPFALKSLSAQRAYHCAVKTRFAQDGRRYRVKEAEALFQTWISKPEVKQFLEQYSIPIYPADL